MVEINYCDGALNDRRIPEVEKRRYRSHMSLDTAYSFLQAQDLSNCKAIYCLHLSAAASNEQEIRERIGMLNKEVIIC